MSKEGYLVLHEEARRSQIYYCVLGEGRLQFYSRRERGILVQDVELSRAKLKVRGVSDQEARGCAFSFSVSVQRSRIVEGRQIVYGKTTVVLLSAPSWAERKSWGNAIHAWQRNYWGEPLHRLANMNDAETEAFFTEQYRALERVVATAAVPVSASVMSAVPSRLFFRRAQSIKQMGSHVRKKIRSASVTISLPPMGMNVTSSLQQQQEQGTEQEQALQRTLGQAIQLPLPLSLYSQPEQELKSTK